MTLLIRTDFTDQARWDELRAVLATPTEEGLLADVALLERPEYADLSPVQLLALLHSPDPQRLLLLADRETFSSHELPVLVVDLLARRELRAVASQLWSVESNLSLATMDFEEFERAAAEEDGVFRGFSEF
ncbi:DUF6924 domain-containing protein [Kitasatospora viridis]|uniref:DUF6924 domain-containing protein n=1 Tax=Kitasatospora viridis TaxID=281105 RepID=A0A561UH48_9ACTN|nr:hypothetical protein [Kitasatospora viridis]TWF98690.1 hypothetical protein FHX73_112511 [Kitasatospora viridis]